MKNKILILAGDPISINSEIIYKSWKKLSAKEKKNLIVIGNYNLLYKQFKKLKYKIKIKHLNDIDKIEDKFSLKIINVPLKFKNPFKIPYKYNSKYVIKCLNLAHKIAMSNPIKGIINCPIDKRLLKKTGNFGVTEFLASKCKILKNSELMLIHNKKLSVAPITTHINLRNIATKINKTLIVKKIQTLNKEFKLKFGKKPRIALLGLNPHNSEFIKTSEEKKHIIPAIKILKKINIKISGPYASDTIFISDYKNYDVVVGMYHDQVLAPFKTLFKFDAINFTLGINYVRVSPDHGTATNLIGKNRANFKSLQRCIKFINNLKK